MEDVKNIASLFITGEPHNREIARMLIASQNINLIDVISNICDTCLNEEISDKRVKLGDSCFLKFRGAGYKVWEFKLCSIEKVDSWDVVKVNGKCMFRDFIKEEETDLTSCFKGFQKSDDMVGIFKNRVRKLTHSNKFKQLLIEHY